MSVIMGVGRGEQERPYPLWVFIHDIDKVEGGLIVWASADRGAMVPPEFSYTAQI